ncbi:aspartic proteinase nepenthesin-1-like [Ananas comosus]|uniref:Aspartic proteinase nepenthesin-1 n=1 Tax=Ananas comosus TaxID=4615 RepID=A0A199VNN6_ANACO|nr:aspartic proteinase nepenthesin-1-like [Ananas comosus]OAY78638.1 Aspartic proteinase nepenthesin-1 [Ananas comosus]
MRRSPVLSHLIQILLSLSLCLFLVEPFQYDLRLELTHVDANTNLTSLQLLHRSIERSRTRLSWLTGDNDSPDSTDSPFNAQVPISEIDGGEYLAELHIGSPPSSFLAILDTSSDIIWIQCVPPVFDPSQSSTFAELPCFNTLCQALSRFKCANNLCHYSYCYGRSRNVHGYLASETFTFGLTNGTVVSSISFGCGSISPGDMTWQPSGFVGLGRGPLSLVSQLGLKKFSYCLSPPHEAQKKSLLLLGSLANLPGNTMNEITSTNLLINPAKPTFYYLPLLGITVGETFIPTIGIYIPEERNKGGFIIDSATSMTFLAANLFAPVKKAFVTQMGLPFVDNNPHNPLACFYMPSPYSSIDDVEVPNFVYHFEGGDMALPPENYLWLDSETGLLCLAIMQSTDEVSVMGSFQQQNIQILYDLENEVVSFMKSQCDMEY